MATVLSQRTFAAGTPWRVSASSIVVVIQGRHVNELEGHGGGDQPRVRRIAEVPRQEREHRAEPLPAGREEVVAVADSSCESASASALWSASSTRSRRVRTSDSRTGSGDSRPGSHAGSRSSCPARADLGRFGYGCLPRCSATRESIHEQPTATTRNGPSGRPDEARSQGLSRGMEPQAEPGRLKGRNVGPEQAEGGCDGSNQTCSFARRDPAGVVRGPAGRRDIGSRWFRG